MCRSFLSPSTIVAVSSLSSCDLSRVLTFDLILGSKVPELGFVSGSQQTSIHYNIFTSRKFDLLEIRFALLG